MYLMSASATISHQRRERGGGQREVDKLDDARDDVGERVALAEDLGLAQHVRHLVRRRERLVEQHADDRVDVARQRRARALLHGVAPVSYTHLTLPTILLV